MRPSRPSIRVTPPIGKPANEDIARVQGDIVLISQRISDLNSEGGRSSYVSTLRTTVSSEGEGKNDVSESKASALDRLLGKVIELDRLVLLKTSPAEGQPVRRSSKTVELHSIPTHLHIIDRLLDLHAQSKRVTVVRTHSVGGGSEGDQPPPESPRTEGQSMMIEALNRTVASLNNQIEDYSKRFLTTQHECSSMRTDMAKLVQDLEATLAAKRDLEARLAVAAAEASDARDLRLQVKTLEEGTQRLVADQAASLQQSSRDEVEALLTAVLEITSLSKSRSLDSHGMRYSNPKLQAAGRAAVEGLHRTLALEFEALQNELNVLHSTREALESELSTRVLQTEYLTTDLATVSAQLEAMKGAYSEMESELIDLRRRLGQQQTQSASAEDLLASQKRLMAANDLLEQLQDDLASVTRRNVDLEKLPGQISDLKLAMVTMENEKAHLKVSVVGLTNEVASYKTLTDSLKDKLRSVSTPDTRDFLDTFEEVMRDEMASMKAAFEAKLKAAKEETDELGRKHHQEIQRLQTSGSSYKSSSASLATARGSGVGKY